MTRPIAIRDGHPSVVGFDTFEPLVDFVIDRAAVPAGVG